MRHFGIEPQVLGINSRGLAPSSIDTTQRADEGMQASISLMEGKITACEPSACHVIQMRVAPSSVDMTQRADEGMQASRVIFVYTSIIPLEEKSQRVSPQQTSFECVIFVTNHKCSGSTRRDSHHPALTRINAEMKGCQHPVYFIDPFGGQNHSV